MNKLERGDVKQTLLNNIDAVSEILNNCEILPYFASGLKQEDHDHVKARERDQGSTSANKLMFEILDTKYTFSWEATFIKSITEKEYVYLLRFLQGKENFKCYAYFHKLIKTKLPEITSQILPMDLLPDCLSMSLIGNEDMEQIKACADQKGNTAAADLLLDRIRRKSSTWFPDFIHILKLKERHDIAGILHERMCECETLDDLRRYAKKVEQDASKPSATCSSRESRTCTSPVPRRRQLVRSHSEGRNPLPPLPSTYVPSASIPAASNLESGNSRRPSKDSTRQSTIFPSPATSGYYSGCPSPSTAGYISCNCEKTKCGNRNCKCKKNGIPCHQLCHRGTTCLNTDGCSESTSEQVIGASANHSTQSAKTVSPNSSVPYSMKGLSTASIETNFSTPSKSSGSGMAKTSDQYLQYLPTPSTTASQISCGCEKSKCDTKICSCRKSEQRCHQGCHKGTQCSNKPSCRCVATSCDSNRCSCKKSGLGCHHGCHNGTTCLNKI